MKFKGTGGGMVSINPNLHPDGKVCLSLLGTWEGPPWRPNESTILQVLISIQAMIFSENPLGNVPGMSSGSGPMARDFNANIKVLTAKFGLLGWASNPPALWKDEVARHFRRNGDKILQLVERWGRDERDAGVPGVNRQVDPRARSALDIATVLPELQKTLQRHGATYKPERFTSRSPQMPYGGRHGSGFGGGGMFDGFGGRRGGPPGMGFGIGPGFGFGGGF